MDNVKVASELVKLAKELVARVEMFLATTLKVIACETF